MTPDHQDKLQSLLRDHLKAQEADMDQVSTGTNRPGMVESIVGGFRKETPYEAADRILAEMKEEGTIAEIDEDEDRLLKAYRQFKGRNAKGVFSWQHEGDPKAITAIETPSLIRDPRDKSET